MRNTVKYEIELSREDLELISNGQSIDMEKLQDLIDDNDCIQEGVLDTLTVIIKNMEV